MVAEELKQLLRATPFRPFTVYMANDTAFQVGHPEFAMLSPRGRTFFVALTDDEAVDILDVPLIARVELHAPRQTAA